MNVLGIDPGLSGAMVLMDTSEKVLWYEKLPVIGKELNLKALLSTLEEQAPRVGLVYLEWSNPIFKARASSTFKFGKILGAIEAILTALKLPFILVAPKRWQVLAHIGTPHNISAKEKSLLAFQQMFPDISFIEGKSKKPHDGLVDACLIAWFGQRMRRVQNESQKQSEG